MVVNVCVLRSGGEYGPQHVQWLARQVPDLVCLSDVEVPGVEVVPLKYDWPGWWSKLALFSDAISGDLMFYDLDTVVLKPLEMPTQTTVLRDFCKPRRMGSGLMYIAQSDKDAVWNAWIEDPAGHMMRCGRGGDQMFLNRYIGSAQKWQDFAAVYSYKEHCRAGLPADAAIVCFHGRPRPWSILAHWVPTLDGE